ncbi:MAG TPA: hypothetical protein VF021_08830 [Longimicrobiales bacterium]
MRRRILCLLLLLFSAGFGQAQQTTQRFGATGISLEAIHPTYDHYTASVLSAAYYLSAHHQLNERILLVAELPFSYLVEQGGFSFDRSSASLGNPYVGLQTRYGIATYNFGVRLPTLSNPPEAADFAVMADIQRMEAFVQDLFTVHAGFALQSNPRNGLTYGMNLSPALMYRTRAVPNRSDLYLDYGANIGYVSTQVRSALRFDGLSILTRDHLTFAEATLHQAVGTVDFGAGRFRPGFYMGVPLDHDMTSMLDVTLGLTFQVALR